MLAYWLLFLAFALGALLTRSTVGTLAPAGAEAWPPMPAAAPPSRRANALFTAAAAFAALMIGLRYQVGGDWFSYLRMFDDIAELNLWDGIQLQGSDPGYSLINRASSALGLQIWAANLACGIIFMFGVVRFARAQPDPWLAAVIAVPYLIIGVGMGYTRQAVAIGLVMAGFAALSKGAFRTFVFWTLGAALFHRTAVILIPIVGLSYARNRIQTMAIAAVASLGGYYFLLAPSLERLSQNYIESVYESQGAGIRLGMNVLPAILFLLFGRRFGLTEPERVTWRNLSIIALIAFVTYFMITSTVFLDRLALYIIPLQLLVYARLPILLGGAGRPSGVAFALLVLYSAAAQFVWLNYANNAITWVPYRIYPLFWNAGVS